MIVIRDVFRAKYGKGGELVKLFKEANEKYPAFNLDRILTDASGPFFTVITERKEESLTTWEKGRETIFSDPGFGDWFAKMMPLVESGSREFYNVE